MPPNAADMAPRVDLPLMTFSSDEDAEKETLNHGNDSRGVSHFGHRDATKAEKDATQVSKENSNNGKVSFPIDTICSKYGDSITSQSIYVRQQLGNNKTAAKLKEQQTEYHSAMIRSLIASKDAKAKETEQCKLGSTNLKEVNARKNPKCDTGQEHGRLFLKTLNSKIPVKLSSRPADDKHDVNIASVSNSVNTIASNIRAQIKDSARSFDNFGLNNRALSTRAVTPPKKSDTADMTETNRLKAQRASCKSIELPLNLTTRNSAYFEGSTSSFPSLPSLDKLQFPKSGHELHFLEGSKLVLRNSQSALASRKTNIPNIMASFQDVQQPKEHGVSVIL